MKQAELDKDAAPVKPAVSEIAARLGARYPDEDGELRFHWSPGGIAGQMERDEYEASYRLRHRDCHCGAAVIDNSLRLASTGVAQYVVPTCGHGNPIEVWRDGRWVVAGDGDGK